MLPKRIWPYDGFDMSPTVLFLWALVLKSADRTRSIEGENRSPRFVAGDELIFGGIDPASTELIRTGNFD